MKLKDESGLGGNGMPHGTNVSLFPSSNLKHGSLCDSRVKPQQYDVKFSCTLTPTCPQVEKYEQFGIVL
jgi:hypothetical protein